MGLEFMAIETWRGFLKDRFTNPRFNVLPPADLEQIKPLSENSSNELWKFWISSEYQRLILLDVNSRLLDEKAIRNIPGKWDEIVVNHKVDDTREFLRRRLAIPEEILIFFFWDSSNSVQTTWGIFLKYWTDFCYPSDDSNIIIFPDQAIAIEYIEDYFSIVNRQKEFGKE